MSNTLDIWRFAGIQISRFLDCLLLRFRHSTDANGEHGGGVFASGRKWALGAKSSIETALCQRITGTDWKKVLANRWNRKRITNKTHAGRGLETIWEIPA
jgi:hypothetical protein